MLREIFHNSFENFEIYKDLYGKLCKRDWVEKIVFFMHMFVTFGGRCNRFGDIRLKILRLPNFSKMNCFRVYRKLTT